MVGGPRILSQPVEVHWAGFRSDTLTLQREGWSISANQDAINRTMQIALRHDKAQMRGIGYMDEWVYERFMDMRYGHFSPPTPIRLESVGERIFSHALTSVRNWNFQPIDATPMFVETPIKSIDDLVYFAPVHAKPVIIPPDSVPDLMERILKIQEPMREEYFREQTKRAGRAPTMHAQIMSLVA
jgi:hypothetical protein